MRPAEPRENPVCWPPTSSTRRLFTACCKEGAVRNRRDVIDRNRRWELESIYGSRAIERGCVSGVTLVISMRLTGGSDDHHRRHERVDRDFGYTGSDDVASLHDPVEPRPGPDLGTRPGDVRTHSKTGKAAGGRVVAGLAR